MCSTHCPSSLRATWSECKASSFSLLHTSLSLSSVSRQIPAVLYVTTILARSALSSHPSTETAMLSVSVVLFLFIGSCTSIHHPRVCVYRSLLVLPSRRAFEECGAFANDGANYMWFISFCFSSARQAVLHRVSRQPAEYFLIRMRCGRYFCGGDVIRISESGEWVVVLVWHLNATKFERHATSYMAIRWSQVNTPWSKQSLCPYVKTAENYCAYRLLVGTW